MKIEFAKATEVTEFAKKLSVKNGYYNGNYSLYKKIYIIPDVRSAWVHKIQVGMNEAFEEDDTKVIVETNKLDSWGVKNTTYLNIDMHEYYVEKVLTEDMENGDGWDVNEPGEYDKVDCVVGDIKLNVSTKEAADSAKSLSRAFDRLGSVTGKFTCDNRSIASWWRVVKKYDRKTYDNLSLSEKVKAKRIMRAQNDNQRTTIRIH